jgi:hypothetical protein
VVDKMSFNLSYDFGFVVNAVHEKIAPLCAEFAFFYG